MNFDMSVAAKAKDGGKRLTPGIKDATFKGIGFTPVEKQETGEKWNCLVLKLDIDDFGEYNQNFFEPTSNERKENKWGEKTITSASPLDHFLITIREIFDALDPQLMKDVESGVKPLSNNKFSALVKTIKEYTDPYIGAKVQIKLLPNNRGFCSMPNYPAGINDNGDLKIATRIIGHDLTFTSSELRKIEAAKNAQPTNMSKSSMITAMAADMADGGDDDLPF